MKNFTLSLCLYLSFCMPIEAQESVELLVITSATKNFSYSASISECQFKTDRKIAHSNMSLMESFYLMPSQIVTTSTNLEFRLGTMMNIRFIFSLKPSEGHCDLSKEVMINDIIYDFKGLDLTFDELWWLKTIRTLTFEVSDQERGEHQVQLRRFDLDEFISLYELSLGAAFNIGTNFRLNDTKRFKRNNPTFEPIPAFMVRYGPLFVNNDGAGTVLLPFKNFFLLATFLLEGEPYHGEGHLERRRSIYAGPLIKSGPWEVHYYRDILGRSHGEVLKITYDAKFKIKNGVNLSLRPFVQYWDKKYNDYYFGVFESEGQRSEVTSGYNFGSSVQVLVKKGQWQFINSLTYKKFSGPVSNSNLTTHSYDWRLITGFSYQIF